MSRLRSHNRRAAKAQRRQVELECWFRRATWFPALRMLGEAALACGPALFAMGAAFAELGGKMRAAAAEIDASSQGADLTP